MCFEQCVLSNVFWAVFLLFLFFCFLHKNGRSEKPLPTTTPNDYEKRLCIEAIFHTRVAIITFCHMRKSVFVRNLFVSKVLYILQHGRSEDLFLSLRNYSAVSSTTSSPIRDGSWLFMKSSRRSIALWTAWLIFL